MTPDDFRLPPFKRLAAAIAKALPPAWRFPVCGLSASVCGLEATEPFHPDPASSPDAALLQSMAQFLGPGNTPPLSLVQSHLATIPGGIAWRRGAHLTADGRLIAPLSVGMNLPMDRWLLKRQRFFPRIHRVPGTVISLSTDGHTNFYHWMLDVLPKLFLVLAAGIRDTPFYVGASTRFQKETLELFGIPPGQVLNCDDLPFLQADRLIVPFLGEQHPPNVFSAAKCRLLAAVFSPLVSGDLPVSNLPARFVISRRKTRSRRIVNEDELLAQLAPLGFRPVCLEDFPLMEQLALFANADAIVASTGAGLINLIHCRPGIPVAILMPEECPDLVCRDIAAFAQLRCEIFFARPHPKGTPDRIGCDIVLDPPLLTKLTALFTV